MYNLLESLSMYTRGVRFIVPNYILMCNKMSIVVHNQCNITLHLVYEIKIYNIIDVVILIVILLF